MARATRKPSLGAPFRNGHRQGRWWVGKGGRGPTTDISKPRMTPTLTSLGLRALTAAITLAVLPVGAAAQDGPPSLVVSIVVDQLRGDLLERYDAAFTGGLRRLIDSGHRFTQASHAHARTSTAPGHTTLSTGVFPSRHGVVANAWYQRVGYRWELWYAVRDPNRPILGYEDVQLLEGRSPATILREGLPDWFAAADEDARIVSISRKDRAAVPMGGHSSEHVYWMVPEVGQFVTSTHYRDSYPGWLRDFNEDRMPEILADEVWESGIPAEYLTLARADSASYEFDGVHTAFPHERSDEIELEDPEGADENDVWQHYNLWASERPQADRAVHELALVALDELQLGRRGHTDYMALSFSATDRVGHQFGPLSPEVLSTLLRLDALLGQFFTRLDEEVGEGRWLVGFSSDHGVATMPEYASTEGYPGAERLLRSDVSAALTEVLNEAAGGGGSPADLAERVATQAVDLEVVEQSYTHHDLTRGPAPDSFAVFYRNSYYPGRAWDDLGRWGVNLRYGDGDYVGFPTGTNHETVYWYDRWVPMVFLGAGVAPGSSDEPVYTVDFAPTLAALAGVRAPDDLDGRRIY